MDTQPELRLRYRELERTRTWNSGRFEFGRSGSGLTVLPRDTALHRHVHRVCGWFECAGGWLITRSADTPNLEFSVESGNRSTDLAPGEPWALQRGPGRARIWLDPDRRSDPIEIAWTVADRPGAVRPAPMPPTRGEIPTVTSALAPCAQGTFRLSPGELRVMEAILEHGADPTVTHRRIAATMQPASTEKAVNKAVERVTGKVRDWCLARDEPFDSRPGRDNRRALVEWLLEHGVLVAITTPIDAIEPVRPDARRS